MRKEIELAKYLYNFKIRLLNMKEYRFNTLLEVAFGNLEMFITIMFWIVIYKSNQLQQINSFELKETITYFVMYSITSKFVLSSSGFNFSDLIKSGKLSSVLIKPYSINLSTFFIGVADAITESVPQIIFVVILYPMANGYIVLLNDIVNLLFMLLFLLFSTIISHLIWCIVGCLAFWVEETMAIMWTVEVIFSFLSGQYLPLDFFPEVMRNVIEYCPWSCFGYIPVKIFLGHYTIGTMTKFVVIYLMWIVILKIVFDFVWNKGNKHYAAVGG